MTENHKLWEFLLRVAKSPNLDDPIDCTNLKLEPDCFSDPRVQTALSSTSPGSWAQPNDPPARDLGKLALKHEAAGKVRVFAMVDAFTQ